MKRERRLYVEAILAEEQQVYWRNRGTEGSATRQAGVIPPDKEGERH
jgi:hypothetical protein